MSMPAAYNIATFYGNTLVLTFTLTDSNNSPISLTGKTVEFIIRRVLVVIDTYTVGDGLTISGGGNNIISLSKVVDISPGQYIYELKITTSPTEIRTYLAGVFRVRQSV